MPIIGTVQATGEFAPSSTGDTYAIIDAKYMRDGFRNVNLLSDLNSITQDRRTAGMVVGISGGTTYYKLNQQPWNFTLSDWGLFSNGSSGSDTYWISGSTGNYSLKTINDSNLDSTGDYSIATGFDTLSNGNYSLTSGYKTNASSDGSTSLGILTSASGGSITIQVPVIVNQSISISSNDPTYSGTQGNAIVFSGDVANEWLDYSQFCNPFTLFDGTGSTTTIDCNSMFDIYYDSISDKTYYVDPNILDTSYTMISGLTSTNMMFSSSPAHSEGINTSAYGIGASSKGINTKAIGTGANSEGEETTASGSHTHAEGYQTTASAANSHAEGYGAIASGETSHAEGSSIAGGSQSHAEGAGNIALGDASHAEGLFTIASGQTAHSEGQQTSAYGSNSHSEGIQTRAIGNSSHAEGRGTLALSTSAHVEGNLSSALGIDSHAEGVLTTAVGDQSHSEGIATIAWANGSHTEGRETTAMGDTSHAEGSNTTAVGINSHAEGFVTVTLGNFSHSEGSRTTTGGISSHAEGSGTTSSGDYSHSEGCFTTAAGNSTHAGGCGSLATSDYSTALGFSGNTKAYGELGLGGRDIGQYGAVVFNGRTTGSTNQELFVNNVNLERFFITQNEVYYATMMFAASNASNQDSAGATITGLIKHVGGTTSIVGSANTTGYYSDTSMTGVTFTLSASSSSHYIAPVVKGLSGTNINYNVTMTYSKLHGL